MLRDVWPFVSSCHDRSEAVALAAVVATNDARPDAAGVLAVGAGGSWSGSVGGGCVDAAVVEAAGRVLAGALPHRLLLGDDQLLPWEPAAGCGRRLEVLVTLGPPADVVRRITQQLAADEPVRLVLTGTDCDDSHVLTADPRPRLVVVGVTDVSATLALLADQVGWRVTLLDPRPVHASAYALPPGADVVRTWPGRWLRGEAPGLPEAVLAVSHDARIDDEAITTALALGIGHVAALGSRSTSSRRTARLADAAGLERLVQPAGLDLGGAAPAEIALSLLAELVAVRHGRRGRPLMATAGPIRQRVAS